MAKHISAAENRKIDCPACGMYVLSSMARHILKGEASSEIEWSNVQRAALSHMIRTRRDFELFMQTGLPYVDKRSLDRIAEQGLQLPIPSAQVRNLIRSIGDLERSSGSSVRPDMAALRAIVGAANTEALSNLAYDLQDAGHLSLVPSVNRSGVGLFVEARLTLAGWQIWEDIRTGKSATRDGFIAMEFGDPRLDEFIATHVQSRAAGELQVSIHRVDSPSVARAGIIDNIMREAIADAAFVLVELSHGNRGAYWEAGYAEGLGKPVIYLCEQAAWDNKNLRPHFDVNHCATVMWDKAEPDAFVGQLVATIRNSMRDET
tara:strand:+ start:8829 stop:9785 length:957 start_codon:yes stop_codon:yes gene_type:complete